MSNTNLMSTPDPWTLVAEGYVSEMQPVFEQYCRQALECANNTFDVAAKRTIMLNWLHEKLTDLPLTLNLRAWIGTGVKHD